MAIYFMEDESFHMAALPIWHERIVLEEDKEVK